MPTKFWSVNLNGRDYLEDVDMDGRILEWITEKQGGKVWYRLHLKRFSQYIIHNMLGIVIQINTICELLVMFLNLLPCLHLQSSQICPVIIRFPLPYVKNINHYSGW